MKPLKLFYLVCLILIPSWGMARGPMTLAECFQAALERSETVALSKTEIEAARARYLEALGSVFPTLGFRFTEFLQDNPAASSNQTTASLNQFSRPQAEFNLHQTLFQGLKEFHTHTLYKDERSRLESTLKNSKRLLYRDVAIAFYTAAKLELDLQTSRGILGVLNHRLGEMKGRVNLGKSRKSELAAQETEVSLLEADLEKKKGDLKVAYEMLSFLTGLSPQPAIRPEHPKVKNLLSGGLPQYTANVPSRADVEAASKAVAVAESQVKITRADLLPRADLQFNYYPYRGGYQENIRWDTQVLVQIPLVNFGTYGQIQEAKVKVKQAKLTASATLRSAKSEVEKAYSSYQSALAQLKKFETASQKAKKSFEEQLQDYASNLVTNLDVLQSQKTWMESLRLLNQAKVQAWVELENLQIAAGVTP